MPNVEHVLLGGQPALVVTYPVEQGIVCSECGFHAVEPDLEPLFECGGCGTVFSRAENGSSRCPECNKFSSKIDDRSCPDCQGGPVEDIEVIEFEGEYISLEDAENRLNA